MIPDSHITPRQHLLALGCLVLGGAAAAYAPNAILAMRYQCVLHRLTGLRCPFCGMTRDFILMAHGSLPQNNPGSLFVALLVYLVYPAWLMAAALRGCPWLPVSRQRLTNALLIGAALLFVCNNLVR
jgi:hypothetical protein